MLVTRNFPPLLGGMEKVNQHLLTELAQKWRVLLCGPAGSDAFVPASTDVAQTSVKPLPRFLAGCLLRAWRMAGQQKPILVVAGSGLVAPIAWLAGKRASARWVVYLHGLDIIAPSRIYRWFWWPFLRWADCVLVNSRNTARLATAAGIKSSRIHVLNPGTDLPNVSVEAIQNFRASQGLAGRKVLLSVGRLTARKGLLEFVENCFSQVLENDPNALLLVIGEDAKDALAGGHHGLRQTIADKATQLGLGAAIRFLPHCDDEALSVAYAAADVHVFPVRDMPGDVEGFGMVALEAAALGLPTVAFDVGGVSDAVSDRKTGRLVAANDYSLFAQAIRDVLSGPRENWAEDCRVFARELAWPRFGERLRAWLSPLTETENPR